MSARILYFATLCHLAFAFSNTVPFVAWSSKRSVRPILPRTYINLVKFRSSAILDLLPAKLSHSVSLLESNLFNPNICDYDAVILVDQPGVSRQFVFLHDTKNLCSS